MERSADVFLIISFQWIVRGNHLQIPFDLFSSKAHKHQMALALKIVFCLAKESLNDKREERFQNAFNERVFVASKCQIKRISFCFKQTTSLPLHRQMMNKRRITNLSSLHSFFTIILRNIKKRFSLFVRSLRKHHHPAGVNICLRGGNVNATKVISFLS